MDPWDLGDFTKFGIITIVPTVDVIHAPRKERNPGSDIRLLPRLANTIGECATRVPGTQSGPPF